MQLLDRLRDGIDVTGIMPAGGVAPGGNIMADGDLGLRVALQLPGDWLGVQHFIGSEMDDLVARFAPHFEQDQRHATADHQAEAQQRRCPSARAPHRRNIPNSDQCLYSTAARRHNYRD